MSDSESSLRFAVPVVFNFLIVTAEAQQASSAASTSGNPAAVGSIELPEGWIVGATGAGDAFCAGMLYSFLSGMPVDEGMRLASCAAACNLSVADSVTGARSLSETLELEKRFERRNICW